MSAFRHVHNVHVRPLEEELAEMGLNPGRVLSEIDRNTAMLEGGPTPLDLAGLHEGSDDVPRSLAQYGSTLLDEKRKSGKGSCKGGKGDDEDDDDEDDDDDDKKDDDEDEDENGNGNGKRKRERKRDGSCKSNGDGEDSEGMGESVSMEYILPEKRRSWSPKPGDNAVYVLSGKNGEHEADIEDISRADAKLVFENPMEFFSQFGRSFAHSGKKWVEWQSPGKVVKAKVWDTGRDPWAGASEMGHVRAAMASNDFDGKDPIEEDMDLARVRRLLGVAEGEKVSVAKLNTAIEKLKAVEDKGDEQKSLLSALVLAKRLKSGVGEAISGEVVIETDLEEAKATKTPLKGKKFAMGPGAHRLTYPSGKYVDYIGDDWKLWIAFDKGGKQIGPARSQADAEKLIGEDTIGEDTISDALYLINEGWELTEVFQIVKKARGAAARLAKRLRHRMYLMHRGAKKLAAKIFRKRFKRKIKKIQKRKEAKFGKTGLSRLHQMGRRVVMRQPGAAKKEWSEALSNIAEEMERDTAPLHEDVGVIEEAEEPFSIAVEVTLNAATTAMYLGEVFDAMGDEAGKVLFQLSDKAVDLAEAIGANGGEPTEEQEQHIQTVLEAVIRALKEHEDAGSPSLGEAIGMAMVAEGKGTWEELVEYVPPSPAELQARIAGKGPVQHGWQFPTGGTASPDPTIAGKYLKAINMAMQKMDPQAAIKATEVVVKKHKVMDSKGLPVHRVDNMTDVLRVMFYLSQITGLKAPAWMYRGKQKPWFVTSDEAEDQTGKAKATDKELATALKALGAPAGVLAALAAA